MTRAPERPSTRLSGFTFPEIVVALAIIAILTAVIVPGLALRMRSAQAASIIQDMRTLNSAIAQYRENVGRYPGNLNELASSTVPQLDLCGNTLPASLSSLWRGPYVAQDISNGFVSGDALILLPLTRNPATTAPNSTVLDGVMKIDITRVDSLSAEAIEAAFDGYSASVTRYSRGTIQWVGVAGAGGLGKVGALVYVLPVRGC